MAFWGDYHTHTIYSHGKGTIEENVLRAREIGLKEIAITDHGFRHMMYNVSRMDYRYMREDVENAKKKYPDINVYLGLETNLTSRHGKADVIESDMQKLDLLICGYHKFVLPDKYDVDIVSHINYGIRADAVEVARACKYYGTYVELNGKRISMTDEDLAEMASEGAEFICDSDAHSVNRVGDFSVPVACIERVGIPYSQIANWERLPKFRSRRKKGLYDEENN